MRKCERVALTQNWFLSSFEISFFFVWTLEKKDVHPHRKEKFALWKKYFLGLDLASLVSFFIGFSIKSFSNDLNLF